MCYIRVPVQYFNWTSKYNRIFLLYQYACFEVCWFFVDILLTIVSGTCTVDLFSSGIREEWNLSFALHPRKIGGRANYQLWMVYLAKWPQHGPYYISARADGAPPACLAWPVNSSVLNYWTAIRLNSKTSQGSYDEKLMFFSLCAKQHGIYFQGLFFYVFGLFYPPEHCLHLRRQRHNEKHFALYGVMIKFFP